MDKTTKIRLGTINDKQELTRVEGLCFHGEFNENFDLILNNSSYLCLLAEKDSHIVGYLSASIQYEQSDLNYICVIPSERRIGLGEKLMKSLFSELKKRSVKQLFLEVEESNTAAIGLYLKCGFKEINRRENYYGNKPAIIMEKQL